MVLNPTNSANYDCEQQEGRGKKIITSARKLHILVVEDHADSRQMICELLTLSGYVVNGVADAEAALKELSEQEIDVLFTDVNLPAMGGVDLARKALAAVPHIHVIFSSGHDDSMSRYIDFPSTWLTKPYEYDALIRALAKLA